MSHYTGIHHLAFATQNMNKTIRFWRDLLEMPLVYSFGKPGYRQYFFEISQHDLIAFFEWPDVNKVAYRRHGTPVKGPFVFDHIAIGVVSEDHLWKIMEALADAEFPASGMIDHGLTLSLYSFDPNGIPIEFSYDVHGSDIRQRPLIIDRDPPPTALEGSTPNTKIWPAPDSTPIAERIIIPGDGYENFNT